MKKIILAVDSFKGCMSSEDVEQTMQTALAALQPDCEVVCVPVADGGEGTLDVIAGALKAQYVHCMAHNPCMELMDGKYAMVPSRHLALIEMAAVSGLPLVTDAQRNPMLTTTYGTGELISDALDHGCTNFIVGLGGSATNDAGLGMLQALGYRFYDKEGHLLQYGGQVLHQVASWDDSHRHPRLDEAHFKVACDVTNPFYGPQGAARVFALQKGADRAMVDALDYGLQSLALTISRQTGIDLQSAAGSGAAGGMGGGMIAFLGAELVSGAQLLLQLNGFQVHLQEADMVITGEGKMDAQTLMGKIPGSILRMAKLQGVRVVGVAGQADDCEKLLQAGFERIYAITPPDMPLDEAMKPAVATYHLQRAIQRLCTDCF